MITKITTSKETEQKVVELQSLLRLSTKAAIIRIGIGMALRLDAKEIEDISKYHLKTDGAQYGIFTITSDYTEVYENMMELKLGKCLTDIEATKYFNILLEEGIDLLYAKYQYFGNYEKTLMYLLKGDFS